MVGVLKKSPRWRDHRGPAQSSEGHATGKAHASGILPLVQNYNVIFGGATMHYLIADKSGHSAIVEHRDSPRSTGGILISRSRSRARSGQARPI